MDSGQNRTGFNCLELNLIFFGLKKVFTYTLSPFLFYFPVILLMIFLVYRCQG